MGIHPHDPVRRIDPVVAASCADVRVARENRAVQHEHVVAEHEHLAIHGSRIRDPRRARTLPAHWIGNVHRRLHHHVFHWHVMAM